MHTHHAERNRFIAWIHSAGKRILRTNLDSEFHQLRIEKVRRASPRLMLEGPDEILFELGQRFARRLAERCQRKHQVRLVVNQTRRVTAREVLPY